MPTIPKFAVSLAKLAKSNPKIIPSSPTQITNKRKREPHDKVANQHTKRIKGDTTPLEIKKEKIRKLARIDINVNQYNDLLSTAKKLKNVKTDDLKGNKSKISSYVVEFKYFLDLAKKNLKANDPAIDLFNKLYNKLNTIDISISEKIPTEILKIALLINEEAKRRN